MYVWVHGCMYVCIYACKPACMHVSMYGMYVCMYVWMYTFIKVEPYATDILSFSFAYSPISGLKEIPSFIFFKLRVHMHMNKRKFERNSSSEYYHMTWEGQTKHTSQRVLLDCLQL